MTSSENELETNTLARSESDSSETSSKFSSSESDSEEYEVNATQKKISFSNTKSSKKHKSAKPRSERSLLRNKTSSKKSSASSDKKSIPVLNHFTSNFSDKEQEKFWNEITILFSHILQPISDLIRIATQQANTLSQKVPEEIQPEAEISWPNPIEINFIHETKTQSSASSVQVSTDSSRPKGESEIQHFVPSLLRRPEEVILKGHSPSSKDNNVLLEEWHAPAGFCPDFSLSSEDDFLQSKSLDDESEMSQRLEAQLPQDFTSSPNHCEARHFVSDLGLDSKSQCSAIKKNN
ncbi:hypothetical protein F8M41_019181 [Gigaspora margarita]|uniref:Uncharacterized protein n=1 Tax=Gigaspora margarita TaxID=4874 RepID=A0A8H4B2A3_GIGMA|nr:hypothetical protein F8M41_019181 [Gigaspora margarita]